VTFVNVSWVDGRIAEELREENRGRRDQDVAGGHLVRRHNTRAVRGMARQGGQYGNPTSGKEKT
jgi:hypothetical protein